jgi:hypothetical protein
MKNKIISKAIVLATLVGVVSTQQVFPGNKDRSGQAGANELLLNPYTRSSGMAGANAARVQGLEGQFLNVAGLAFTKKTEVIFSNTSIISGSGIRYNAFGFTQKAGKTGVIGLAVNSLNFGQIDITTVDNPEGGIGKYSVSFNNINMSYAKEFSNSIYGGINIKAISQTLPNLSAKGIAIDAGIQYLTGTNEEKNNVHFGIALKNVGAPMKYSGIGLSIKRPSPVNGQMMTVEQRSALIELPATLNISGAYDFLFDDTHRLTTAATFVSNSYGNDQVNMGVEYGFNNLFMVRAGYSYENGLNKNDLRKTFFTGPTVGFTLERSITKSGSTFGIDYCYRLTNPFGGFHSIGVRLAL